MTKVVVEDHRGPSESALYPRDDTPKGTHSPACRNLHRASMGRVRFASVEGHISRSTGVLPDYDQSRTATVVASEAAVASGEFMLVRHVGGRRWRRHLQRVFAVLQNAFQSGIRRGPPRSVGSSGAQSTRSTRLR